MFDRSLVFPIDEISAVGREGGIDSMIFLVFNGSHVDRSSPDVSAALSSAAPDSQSTKLYTALYFWVHARCAMLLADFKHTLKARFLSAITQVD